MGCAINNGQATLSETLIVGSMFCILPVDPKSAEVWTYKCRSVLIVGGYYDFLFSAWDQKKAKQTKLTD